MKIALKRLTASDLTFFEYHFRTHNAGNQKSINLNADVFVEQLFPVLRDSPPAGGKLGLDLYVYGPAIAPELNLQRKIVKGSAYKNWRLNGEFIHDPQGEPGRFNSLAPGDIAILAFDGAPLPHTGYLYLIAAADERRLHRELDAALGSARMRAVPEHQVAALLTEWRVPKNHLLWALDYEADLEEAAEGAAEPRKKLARRAGGGRRIDREQLARARDAADAVGRRGEEIVCAYLETEKLAGRLDYSWVSDTNAVASHDFEVEFSDRMQRLVEVKSTSGEFDRAFHMSMAEVEEAAQSSAYDIFRVSHVDPASDTAKLHVSGDMPALAQVILQRLSALPAEVEVDGVSIDVAALTWRDYGEITIPAPME